MLYLKIEDFPDLIEEQIDLHQFQVKYPNINPIPLGTVDDKNRTLTRICDFVINKNGIWQWSDYDDAQLPHRKMERLVSFHESLSAQELLEKSESLVTYAETTLSVILSTPLEVIDPETFEPFDKASPEFTQYCEKLKVRLDQLRVKVQSLREQVRSTL